MIKILGAAAVVGLALLLSACGGGAAPTDKMMAACLRMNKDQNAQSNCTCMTGKLKEKLSDSELSDLADQLNEIMDKTNGNSDAAGQEIGTRMMMGTLVNSKVAGEFLAASKACSVGQNGAPGAPGAPAAPAPAMPMPTPAPAPSDATPAPADAPPMPAPSDSNSTAPTPSP